MRFSVIFVGLGVLALNPSATVALGCLDIPGAKIDPDLAALSTSFGRLLPDRSQVTDTRVQTDTIAIERLIATRIATRDGTASADLILSRGNITKVSGIIDGKKFTQTTQKEIADLGYTGSAAMLATALAKIDLPANAFVPAKLPQNVKLDDLSPESPKLVTELNKQSIKGPAKTETAKSLRYTCTQNADFAGDPADLSTMVVLKGVVKATTETRTTKIDNTLNVEMSDVATLQLVTRKEFQAMLAVLPGIADLMQPVKIAQNAKVASPDATPQITPAQPANDNTTPANTTPANTGAVENQPLLSKIVTFFSLSKPGTWILLLIAALLSTLAIIKLRTSPRPLEKQPEKTLANQPDKPTEKPTEKPTKEQAEKDKHETVMASALMEQVAALKGEIAIIKDQSQELRKEKQELKVKLDKSENTSRDLTSQLIELQTSSALMESRLSADQRSVFELKSSNKQLMGVNDSYRDKINAIEADYTTLMEKLMNREDALNRVEGLSYEMQGINDEINHALGQEQTARISLEAEYQHLLQDYDNLWSQTSDRVEQARKETVEHRAQIRLLEDEVLSLSGKMESIRKDRDELNREFFVLDSENSRMSNEHATALNEMKHKINNLHVELTIYRGLLEENKIQIPQRTRLPAPPRRPPEFQDRHASRPSRRQAFEEDRPVADNVVPLTVRKSDKAG